MFDCIAVLSVLQSRGLWEEDRQERGLHQEILAGPAEIPIQVHLRALDSTPGGMCMPRQHTGRVDGFTLRIYIERCIHLDNLFSMGLLGNSRLTAGCPPLIYNHAP